MFAALYSFLASASLLGAETGGTPVPPGVPVSPYGYLWFYQPDGHGGTVKHVCPYVPHEADILFFDDMSKFWEFLYHIGKTAPPFHTGIMFRKPDGTFHVLESGPDDTLHVYLLEACERVHTFKGILQVRRCKVPLTREQSCTLTNFALAQEGKHYAVWRLLLQGTPIKTRGGPMRLALAKTRYERCRWLCTEIVVAAAELIGLMDPNVVKATNTYPLDIVDDHMYDLSAVWDEAGYWSPHP